ncbi:MAG: heat-inducible transcription repressor HrcA [Deltaproteobacteria bacterium]|nr:heat-inducible transcription repressor HrcA [Deltaproteobacteria bacterium]
MLKVEKLTERQIETLNIVIKSYIQWGEARGSRSLKDQFRVDFSPATLRNTMSELEGMGYLTHLHASGGKIPTYKGYRYYVENLLNINDNKPVVFLHFKQPHTKEISKLLKNVAYEISNIAQCISITFFNLTPFVKLKKISFVKLNENEILSIVASNIGGVESKIVCTEASFSQSQLNDFSEYLSKNYYNWRIKDIRKDLLNNILSHENECKKLFLKVVEDCNEREIYIAGQKNMLSYQEFIEDIDRLKRLLSTLEKKKDILKLLEKITKEENPAIIIGEENPMEELHLTSIIAAPYLLEDDMVGVFSIIGPLHMNYEKIIRLVSGTSKKISMFLDEGV